MKEANLAAGIDLNRDEPQICYYNLDTGDTVTAPMKIGNEGVSFRDILDGYERKDEVFPEEPEVWELKRRRLEEQASDIFRQALATLGLADPSRSLRGLVTCVPRITKPVISLMKAVYGRLGLGPERAFLMDYRESFFYHTFCQKKELHARNAGLFRFTDEGVSFFSLSQNLLTRPVTVTADEKEPVSLGEEEGGKDLAFYRLIEKSLQKDMYSSVFLMGEDFEQSRMPRSTALLCRNGRKVFVVDRLFARGACYAAREKTVENTLGGYLYLGDDLVRSNISMQMVIQGTETSYPVVTAGVNWYEAGTSFSCLLNGEPELVFQVTGIDGTSEREIRMDLSGLPKRPPKTTRLDVSLSFVSAGRCVAEVRDAGFGDLYPSGGQVWREEWEDL